MIHQVLGFVEDPGSANFFVGLSEALGRLGIDLKLFAEGSAISYLWRRNQEAKLLPAGRQEWTQAIEESDLLLVGTSENRGSAALEMILEARASGVLSAAIVDAPNAVAERFEREPAATGVTRPDLIITIQNIADDILDSIQLLTKDVRLIRHPYYDAVEQRQNEFAAMDKLQKRKELFGDPEGIFIVFLCEVSDGLRRADYCRSSDYTLAGKPSSVKRTHIVLDELLLAIDNLTADIRVVARLHPKDDVADYSTFVGRIDQFSRDEDPLEVVYFADAVIGMTTSLLIEAALLGKPVLSIIPRPEEQSWMPNLLIPGVSTVWSRQAIQPALLQLLSDAPICSQRRSDVDRLSLADTILTILRKQHSS